MTEVIIPGQRLGKKAKVEDPRNLQMGKYLTVAPTTLTVPPSADFSTLVNPWPMYGNNDYGNCTCASVGHGVQLLSAMAGVGNTVNPTDAQVMQMYYDENNGGQPFSPGSPFDQGAAILDVVTLWKQKGMAGVAPFAFVEVDVANINEVKVAISLFGGLDIGVQLPMASQSQPEWNTVYEPNNANTWPGTWGGHSIWVVAFDDSGVTVVSWGRLIKMTWAFWKSNVDEGYAFLPDDWKTRPDGFDFATLEQDLTELGGIQ